MKPFNFSLLVVLALPAFGQAPPVSPQPKIILPSKEKKFDDSRTLAGTPMPLTLNGLGLLASDLSAYLPMDDSAKGCLAWSRKPISVKTLGGVKIKEEEGRAYADFSEKGARLIFEPPLELGGRFTLAAWIQAPAPHNNAVIWHGSGGLLLMKPESLTYWTKKASGAYAKATAPFHGWMHVAVTCDGAKTQAYLNGAKLDSVTGIVSSNLVSVGNHSLAKESQHMMAAGIDEQYFFSRALTVDEIKKVMSFSQPKK